MQGVGAQVGPIRRHVWVSGTVQGVWFRQSCAEQARVARIGGWVRNTSDRRVEAVFEGEGPAVARLVSWCHVGPERAKVTCVEVATEEPEGFSRFTVRGWG